MDFMIKNETKQAFTHLKRKLSTPVNIKFDLYNNYTSIGTSAI